MNEQMDSGATVPWKNEKPTLALHTTTNKKYGRTPQASPTGLTCDTYHIAPSLLAARALLVPSFSGASLHLQYLAQVLLQSRGGDLKTLLLQNIWTCWMQSNKCSFQCKAELTIRKGKPEGPRG